MFTHIYILTATSCTYVGMNVYNQKERVYMLPTTYALSKSVRVQKQIGFNFQTKE